MLLLCIQQEGTLTNVHYFSQYLLPQAHDLILSGVRVALHLTISFAQLECVTDGWKVEILIQV
jgi:hypothetical protein